MGGRGLVKMDKLLVVGAGATGALTASLLSEKAAQHFTSMTVWDKANGCGGRMTTRRNETHHQIDMGAQYLTRFNSASDSAEEKLMKDGIFKELVDNGVLSPFTGAIEGDPTPPPLQSTTDGSSAASSVNYVCRSGMNSVPKYFLRKSVLDCHFQRQLKSVDIDLATKQIECGWSHSGVEGKETFNCLILTTPIPQLLSLAGNFTDMIQRSHLDNLKSVEYSSRYAMGLGFEDTVPDTTWSAKYFKHPIIRYACWDHLKRGGVPANKPCLLVHTSVPFGLQHLEEDKDAVSALIGQALPEVLPGLPTPKYTYLLRWRYSQVFRPYPSTPGCVVLHSDPLVIATGDAFTHSNIEGCIVAASHTVGAFLNNVRNI